MISHVNEDSETAQNPGLLPKRGRGRPREFDRQQGLQKAMELFWVRGYEATSMGDLRASLGITQASLYAAYGNKEALFREAVALYRRTSGNTTARALAGGKTARDAIQTMLLDAVTAFTLPDAKGGCMIVLGAVNCAEENTGVLEYLRELRLQTPKQIVARLRRGQREGDVPKDISLEPPSAFYTTVLHGLSIQARDGASRAKLMMAVRGAMSCWDHFVQPRLRSEGKPERRSA